MGLEVERETVSDTFFPRPTPDWTRIPAITITSLFVVRNGMPYLWLSKSLARSYLSLAQCLSRFSF